MPRTRKQNLQSEDAKKVIILRRGPRATPTVKFWWLSVRKWHERLTKHFFSITNSNVSFTLLAISISWEEAKQSYFHIVSFKDGATFWLFKLPCPRSFSFPAASRLSRVGRFSRALAFRSLYYPWGKMGSTRSLLQPRPQGFSLKKWVLKEKPWGRGWIYSWSLLGGYLS